MTLQYSLNFELIPPGYCQCGCGNKTPIFKRSRHYRGTIKGEPQRYIKGHQNSERIFPRQSTEGVECPPGSKVIALTLGKFAFVDDADYESVSRYPWAAYASGRTFYAVAKVNGKQIKMHQFIMGKLTEGKWDHKNHNGIDNRKSNLRVATNAQNVQNAIKGTGHKSTYKGAHYSRGTHKQWRSTITVNGNVIKLGRFETEIEAARAYDAAAKEHFGEFACLNFPE